MKDTGLGEIDGQNHVKAAEKAIEASHFVIVIVDDEMFEAKTDSRPSYQQLEVEHAFKVRKARLKDGVPFRIFFVHLQDEYSEDEREILEEAISELRYVGNSKETIIFVPSSPEHHDGRKNAIEQIGSNVREFLDVSGLKAPIGTQNSADGAPHRVGIPERLEPYERAYLFENIDNWLKGHHGDIKRVGGYGETDATRTHLFDFNLKRELVLRASVPRGSGEANDNPDQPKTYPLIKRLLKTDDSICFVTGPSGMGKTTQLTLSAALCALRLDPTLSADEEKWLNSEIAQSVNFKSNRDAQRPFPIVVECSNLAEIMETKGGDSGDNFDALMGYLANLLSIEVGDGVDPGAAFAEQLKKRAFVFFFDALDEVVSKTQRGRIVSSIRYLNRELRQRERETLITVSAREIYEDAEGFRELAMEELDDAQVDAYFERFSRDAVRDTRNINLLCAALRKRFADDIQLADVLRRPFSLNSFCYLVHRKLKAVAFQDDELDRIPNTQADIVSDIIKHLIDGFQLPIIAGQQLSPELFRLVLRRLAFDVLTNGEKGKISIREGEERVQHTLASVLFLQSDDIEFFVQPDEAKYFLESITAETDLLHKDDHFYTFERQKFCEYLAAERIDRDAMVVNYIRVLGIDTLPQLKDVFAFCFAIRLKSQVYSSARKILEHLLIKVRDEANQYSHKPEEAYLANTFTWLRASIYCAAAGREMQMSTGATSAEEIGLQSVVDEGTRQLKTLGHLLDPSDRDDLLGSIMALCQHKDTEKTISNVWSVIGKITNVTNRWKEFPSSHIAASASGNINYKVARSPVLVCEYQAFVEEHGLDEAGLRSAGVWDHTPDKYIKTLDNSEMIGRTQINGSEHWRKMRSNSGHPVSLVSWYEAVAYARWLTWRMRQQSKLGDHECYRLPTRYEMQELMISVSEGGTYPWGDELREPRGSARINYLDAGIGGVSTVGTFKESKEFIDLGSNVYTWCIDTDENGNPIWPPLLNTDGRQPITGASWYTHDGLLDADRNPEKKLPETRNAGYGIRLVCTDIATS
ncbi:MAG: SUMF1/EgtB/PvdO family nonheme iron enzyme [Roseobacter sp.]